MIQIRKAKDSDKPGIFQLKVNDNQVRYVGVISDLWDSLEKTMHSHVILSNEALIGFFIVDTAYSANHDFANENELGLRSFFIDARKQNLGFGRLAVQGLRPYLESAYGSYSSLALSVNCQNPNAYKAYIKGGFLDTGHLYHGGQAGPQHILRMALGTE